MPEVMQMKEKDLRDHILKTTQELVEDVCGKLVGEKVEESIKLGFEKQQQEWESGYPDFIKTFTEKNAQPEPKKIVREKGGAMGRYMRAFIAGDSKPEGAEFWLRKWGDTDLADDTKNWFEKDAQMATNPNLGGYLIPPAVSADVVELLRPASIMRRLGAVVLPMDRGNFSIPRVTQGSTAYYQGESENITPSKMKFGQIQLIFKKLTALVPVSNDLVRYSSPGADAIVRDDMVRSVAQRENQAFLRDDGTDATPKGLLYWAPSANKFDSSGTTLALMTADLGQLLLKLLNNDIPMTRPVWIMSPKIWNALVTVINTNGFYVFRDEMVNNQTLWGWPFALSTAVPINLGGGSSSELYLVDMADMIIGESLTPRIDSSPLAAYHDGSAVVSAYSKDETVIRVISEHDFVARREESIAVLETVNWS
jgi:HK97 family phage major capsid protein